VIVAVELDCALVVLPRGVHERGAEQGAAA
jgi:hypothetical protein